jgi:hypothetical protein
MKRLGTIAICLAGGLALCAGARAGDIMLAGNPYEPIVARNIFGLNPPSLITEDPNKAIEGLPKITPNGIMSIFGQLQVLFKVAPKPGQKDAKEASFVLSEGQAQDDIEVVRIDEKAALVTFNNNGIVQELPLANAPKITAPAIGGSGGGVNAGGTIPPRFGGLRGGTGGAGGVGGPAPRFGGPNRGSGIFGGNASGSTGGGATLNSVPTRTRGGSAAAPGSMSADEQAIMTEIQREEWRQQGKPSSIIPPTSLTPLLQGGDGGASQ